MIGGALASQGDLQSKIARNQKLPRNNFRGVYFMQKYEILNFQRPPILRVPKAPTVASDQNVA
jgi:hypothetical protein